MATIDRPNSLLVQKRDRLPSLSILGSTSSAGQPLRKVVRKAIKDFITNEEGLTIWIMDAIWPNKRLDNQTGSKLVKPHVARPLLPT